MSQRAYRRSPRLVDFDYQGPLTAFLTIVTRGRRPIFDDGALAKLVLSHLQSTSLAFNTDVLAYCIMPEHVHLLISVPEGTSMKDFVRRFKQTSAFALKKQLGSEAWQVSYYDRILRVDESAEDVARYIWNNPIEDGLVEDASEYPWNGPREFIS